MKYRIIIVTKEIFVKSNFALNFRFCQLQTNKFLSFNWGGEYWNDTRFTVVQFIFVQYEKLRVYAVQLHSNY